MISIASGLMDVRVSDGSNNHAVSHLNALMLGIDKLYVAGASMKGRRASEVHSEELLQYSSNVRRENTLR